ncbi:DUF1993 family protein [Roseomonas sp. 18066]|uniref:DUF1993 domain-containing protein n=1 Tax=Roseomonas sp. 18066 TaxID=2681412 RepID=UPI00135A432B|nr:DUF1993 domain-containing protein [Roseomonas sp. 18066]
MPIPLHTASTAIFLRGLTTLSTLLQKAEAHAAAEGLAPEALIQARLAPDMRDLAAQVQMASDAAKAGAGRLADVERPSFPDTETSFAELQARIQKTIDYVQGIDPAATEGGAERAITLTVGGRDYHFTGAAYLTQFALPNFFFHVTTAYDILRAQGLKIGKLDFLGPF